jgi:hypothetical protein
MGFEAKLRLGPSALDHAGEACRAERRTTFRREHEWALRLLFAM